MPKTSSIDFEVIEVIHLPARPASETHKFPKKTHKFSIACSICMQKVKIAITPCLFLSYIGYLTGSGDMDPHKLLTSASA